MRLFLLFLSSLITCFTFQAIASEPDDTTVETRTEASRMSFRIEMQRGYVSGILITADSGTDINGAMINEFGISALDFTYSRKSGKVKLLNVISFLNKWYIKRVLRSDLGYCIHILYGTPFSKERNYKVTRDGDSLSIVNTKRNISYIFSPITYNSDNHDTEE